MTQHDEKLTARQYRFLAALMTAPNLMEASRQAGCNDDTGRRWLKLAHVQAAYNEMCQDVCKAAVARLQKGMDKAIDALERNLSEDAPPQVQVSAARIWMEHARLDSVETKIAVRGEVAYYLPKRLSMQEVLADQKQQITGEERDESNG